MSIRAHNKLVTIGVATLIGVPLVCLGAALDGFAPHGTTLGFLMRTVPVALAIPALLIAFNFLCDKWERHGRLESSLSSRRRLDRHVFSDQQADGELTVGSVTRIKDYAETNAGGMPARSSRRGWHLDWSRRGALPPASRHVAGQ